MANIVFGSGAQRVVGLTQAQGFGIRIEETPAYSGSSETPGTYKDISFTGVTITGVQNNCRIHVSDSYLAPGHSFRSMTPDIATVDAEGNVAMVSAGLAEIIVSTPRAGAKRYTRQMSASSSSQFARFVAFEAGSLGAHCVAQVKALLSGKSPGSATQRYWSTNSGGVAAPNGVRNAANFAASVDLSGVSMCMTGRANEQFPVMLVSPRHAITARHVVPAVGADVVFQRADASYQTVTITAVTHLTVDLSVVYFGAAVTGIAPFSIMPPNFTAEYAPSMLGGGAPYYPGGELPTLQKTVWNAAGSAESWLSVGNITYYPPDGSSAAVQHNARVPQDAEFVPWYNPLRGGDSGSPQFLLINGEPVLLLSHSSATGSPSLTGQSTAINTAMNALATAAGDPAAGTYAVQTVNLSGFTSYA